MAALALVMPLGVLMAVLAHSGSEVTAETSEKAQKDWEIVVHRPASDVFEA